MKKLFIEELSILPNDLVIVRADLNVPLLNGKIQNYQRIKASLPTLRYLQTKQARVVILSHLGRPKGKIVEELRLAPIAQALKEYLSSNVCYVTDCIGPLAQEAVAKLQAGEVLLLENVRFPYRREGK